MSVAKQHFFQYNRDCKKGKTLWKTKKINAVHYAEHPPEKSGHSCAYANILTCIWTMWMKSYTVSTSTIGQKETLPENQQQRRRGHESPAFSLLATNTLLHGITRLPVQ